MHSDLLNENEILKTETFKCITKLKNNGMDFTAAKIKTMQSVIHKKDNLKRKYTNQQW